MKGTRIIIVIIFLMPFATTVYGIKVTDAQAKAKAQQYWGQHLVYGAWSTGNITDEIIKQYLEHQRTPGNIDTDNNILE